MMFDVLCTGRAGFTFRLHERGSVLRFTRTGAEAVAELHERLFGYTAQVELYMPLRGPYSGLHDIDPEAFDAMEESI